MMKLVILDRDGVINQDSDDYIKSPEEWVPIPRSLEAIRLLTEAGFLLAIATNQGGIGKGLYTEEALRRIHEKMLQTIVAAGGEIAVVEYCPHSAPMQCLCRKPKPEMLNKIARQFSCDLKTVPYIGDKYSDYQAAKAAGAQPFLVKTGYGLDAIQKLPLDHDAKIFADLYDATEFLLATK